MVQSSANQCPHHGVCKQIRIHCCCIISQASTIPLISGGGGVRRDGDGDPGKDGRQQEHAEGQ